jgi:hypothetical protein
MKFGEVMMFDGSNSNANVPKTPRGFLGTLADLMKNSNQRPAARRNGNSSVRRPQPKKPCGGCGGK